MKNITKILGLGAAITVVGTIGWHAVAQTPPPGMGMAPGMMMGMGRNPMAERFADPAAHLASLKTELDITPQQQPAWNAYAKVVQDNATSMRAHHQGIDMTTMHGTSDEGRQAFMTQMRNQHEKEYQSVMDAANKLLTALDDTQRTKAKESLPGLAPRGPGMTQHAGMSGHNGTAGTTR